MCAFFGAPALTWRFIGMRETRVSLPGRLVLQLLACAYAVLSGLLALLGAFTSMF
jgi:hypothetical protein